MPCGETIYYAQNTLLCFYGVALLYASASPKSTVGVNSKRSVALAWQPRLIAGLAVFAAAVFSMCQRRRGMAYCVTSERLQQRPTGCMMYVHNIPIAWL